MGSSKRRQGQSNGGGKRVKVETEEEHKLPKCCTFYPAQSTTLRFLPLPDVIGCTELSAFLQLRIGEPLADRETYEISEHGTAIVERFLHFNGCKKNSFSTYLKSFCESKQIALFCVHKSHMFDVASNDFDTVFEHARRKQPSVIYIANHDQYLFSTAENSKVLSMLTNQCKKIRANHHAVWVVLRTNIPNFEEQNPLYWDFYEYFVAGYRTLPLQNDVDVAFIFRHCLAKYLPEHKFSPDDVVMFATQYMRHCTYFQIDTFVRTVVFDAQNKLEPLQRRANPRPNIPSLAAFSHNVRAIVLPTGSIIQSILSFSPLQQNQDQYKAPKRPPPPLQPSQPPQVAAQPLPINSA